MADVEISYKGSTIASMSASGTKTLLTEGKYCEDDITVEYTSPGGGGSTLITKSITVNGTYDAEDDNADGYSSVTVNVNAGPKAVLKFEDFTNGSTKWVAQNCIPNSLKTGGCVHIRLTLPTNNTSSDQNIIGFGVGTMSSWSPGTSAPCAYLIVSANSSSFSMYLRGQGNTSLTLHSLKDANNKIDVKFYSDHYYNVNTSSSINYSTAQQTFFTSIATKDYLSVGINQNYPLSGATVDLWAIENS